MNTEQVCNMQIEELNPNWILVLKQPKENLWRREYGGEKDYVVSRGSEIPTYEKFGRTTSVTKVAGAYRFKTFPGAMKFILIRSSYRLKINNNNIYPMREVPLGTRLWKILKEKEPLLPFLKQKGEPNCEIKRGYLRSIKNINQGESLIL